MSRKQTGVFVCALVSAIAAVWVAIAVFGAWPFGHSGHTAQAQGPVEVGFDMYPYFAPANSCPDLDPPTQDCTLGSIEACVWVPSGGGDVEFDIYLEYLPPGESVVSWWAHIGEKHDLPLGSIMGYIHDDPLVNLPAQPGSSISDVSDPPGTAVPCFDAWVADFGTAEWNPPFTHGTLGRYVLQTTGIPDGVYGMTLGNVGISNSDGGQDLCALYGCDIKDAFQGYGLIAVGVPCPGEADLYKKDLQMRPFYGLGPLTKFPDMADDDGDTVPDEDPKDNMDNDADTLIDEDPYGFIGMDNDGDTLVDEDGAGRIDFNGDTVITPYPDCVDVWYHEPDGPVVCMYEDQLQGRDDDGDGLTDEDPFDADASVQIHYILKEILRNNGWEPLVHAWDVKEIDAPDMNEAGDPVVTEVSAHILDPIEEVSAGPGVPAYVKPQCMPPAIPADPPFDVGPYQVPALAITYGGGTPFAPGDCFVVESVPGVVKELDVHKNVVLPYYNYMMELMDPLPPLPPGDPISTIWEEMVPIPAQQWHLISWHDNDLNGELSIGDQIDMELVAPPTFEVKWFYVEFIDPEYGYMDLTEEIVVEEQFDLHCYEPSLHKFLIQNEIYAKDQYVTDPDPGNNALAMELAVACITPADAKVLSEDISLPPTRDNDGDTLIDEDPWDGLDNDGDTLFDEDPPDMLADDGLDNDGDTLIDEDPIDGSDNDGDTAIDEDGGEVLDLTAHAILHNNGPAGRVVISQHWLREKAPGSPVACTIEPPLTTDQAALDISFTVGNGAVSQIHCGPVGAGIDDDGDTLIDEDPIDGLDNDGDTLTDEDDVVGLATFVVSTFIEPKEPHMDDPDLLPPGCDPGDPASWPLCGNNFASSSVVVIVEAPPVQVADLYKKDLQMRPFYGIGGLIKFPDMADDDGDTMADEDPKNGMDEDGDQREDGSVGPPFVDFECMDGIDNDSDTLTDWEDPDCLFGPAVDEDPPGFLGIDNDGDTLVDEDGAGRMDFNGDTVIEPYPGFVDVDYHGMLIPMIEDQAQGRDDDGDQLEDGGVGLSGTYQCDDGIDNDSDTLTDSDDPDCQSGPAVDEDPFDASVSVQIHYRLKEILRNNGPEPLVHAWDVKEIDAPDTDEAGAPVLTEVSAHILDIAEEVSAGPGVLAYVKPMCMPPKVPADAPYDVGPYQVPAGVITWGGGIPFMPGDCFVVESVPGVLKELDVHKNVELPHLNYLMQLVDPPPPLPSGDPISTTWEEMVPIPAQQWHLISWHDNDANGELSIGDQIDMELVAPPIFEVKWFHVEFIDPIVGFMELTEEIVVEEQFDLHCYQEGLHKFLVQNEIYAEDPTVIDPDPGNNALAMELAVLCLAGADSKVTDVGWNDPFGSDLDPVTPDILDVYQSTNIPIEVYSVEHNNGPVDAESMITFLADIPLGCEGQWQWSETDTMRPYDPLDPLDQGVGAGYTPEKDPGDGVLGTAESVSELPLYEPVSVPSPFGDIFELHCLEPGLFTFHFCNKQEVFPPWVDPDLANNWLCFDLVVNSIPAADSEVIDVGYDDLGNDVDPGTPELDVYTSTNIPIDVYSVEHNNGPEDAQSMITFLADIPLNCEGQWLNETDTMRSYEPLDPLDQGVGVGPTPGKDSGDGVLGTAESVTEAVFPEPVSVPVPAVERFELHCWEPGLFTFTLCNKQEVLPPEVDPDLGNNWLCFDLVVNSIPGADSKVTDVGWEDPYGSDLDPGTPDVLDIYKSTNIPIDVYSVEHNNGPLDAESMITFLADIPLGCEGQWLAETDTMRSYEPLDPLDQGVGVGPTPGKDPGDGVLGTAESVSEMLMPEPVSVPMPVGDVFELHCWQDGLFTFHFCNKQEVLEPMVDPDLGNNWLCFDLVVNSIPNADSKVTDVAWNDLGNDLDPGTPDVLDIYKSSNVPILLVAMQHNNGPQNAYADITYLADIPLGCEGQWLLAEGDTMRPYDPLNPLDQGVGAGPTPGKDPGDGVLGTAESVSELLGVLEHVSVPVVLYEDFELHCWEEGLFTFHFCNKQEVLPPEIDPDLTNNWQCFDLEVNSIPTADSKVTDVFYDDLGNDLDPGTPELDVYTSSNIAIDVSSVEHNNGPEEADSTITFLADIPLGCEGQWLNETHTWRNYDPLDPLDQDTGVGPTAWKDDGDGVLGTAESVTEAVFLEPVGVPITAVEGFELHCWEDGLFTFTLCNKQEVLEPMVDPDLSNNWQCFDLVVNSIANADKQVTDIVFDYANTQPCQGKELPLHPTELLPVLEVERFNEARVSVKSIEYNAGAQEPPDSQVNFYADIPAGCEGQWVLEPTIWPHDTRSIWGDPYAPPLSPEQKGMDDPSPDKEVGDGIVGTFESDLHFQTADYGIEEPVGEEVEIVRFFDLVCDPGQHHFTFCNKIEPKPPYEDPNLGNNLRCEEMVVQAVAPGEVADKQVLGINFDTGDEYPCPGLSLRYHPLLSPPGQTASANVGYTHLVSVSSTELNAGPNQPDNVEVSFYANIPAGCAGRWVVDAAANPHDTRTRNGDPGVGSSGTPVPPSDPMEPGGYAGFESDLHFQTADYGIVEPVGVQLPITRFFEFTCTSEGMFEFTFCNRADVKPPETDPDLGNNLQCAPLWVLTPNAPGCANTDASYWDTWTDCQELHMGRIGTDYLDDCPDDPSDAALPPDHDNNMEVDILDVLHYKWKLQPPWPYDPRYDLNIDKTVDILDVLIYKWQLYPNKNWPCTNP